MGVPATGKKVEFTGTTIVQMKDGKIAARWSNLDMLRLLQQLGIVPPPPGS
jgi:predicted ester cyclase